MKRVESSDTLVLDRIAGARHRSNGICVVLIFQNCSRITGVGELCLSECAFFLSLIFAFLTSKIKKNLS